VTGHEKFRVHLTEDACAICRTLQECGDVPPGIHKLCMESIRKRINQGLCKTSNDKN